MKTQLVVSLAIIGMLMGCAKERPVKPVIANGKRIEKSSLQGTYLFAKTINGSRFNGGSKKYKGVPVGRYVADNVLVQFKINQTTLDIVSVDPLFKEERAALQSTLLARFPVKHVDVLRKQNADGDDTNEEEETESRRPWQERTYVIIDTDADSEDGLAKDAKSTSSSDTIAIDKENGAINFDISRVMNDDSQLSTRYSFLKFVPSSSYQQVEYPIALQERFGFFKTDTLKFDGYGRITQTDKKEYINRWDTTKKIVYYLSKNYPKTLIEPTKRVFASWNESFKKATGRDVLEVKENSGQELGDLRYSMVTYDETVDASHGILGYGPTYSNPRTGEIIKGDVILYGGVLKSSLYRERIWQKLLEDPKDLASGDADEEIAPALENLNRSRMGLEPFKPELLANVSSLVSRYGLNQEMLQSIRGEYHPNKMGAQLKKEMVQELHQNVTRMNQDIAATIADGAKSLSDEDLEVQIFMPLLTHELGHNWGLRHNFMGSGDERHFGKDTKTSSIMDYGFLTSHEGTEPGSYDRAAILVSYGADSGQTQSLVNENYFYCSDEDVFSAQTAFCNQHDAGTTLTEIVSNQFKRYQASWILNNTRMDRVFFNYTGMEDYQQRVIMSLLSLRNMYDHATQLVKSVDRKRPQEIWLLARQRVEADATTDPKNIIKTEVLSGTTLLGEKDGFGASVQTVEKFLDAKKIAQVQFDAKLARVIALSALREIILSDVHPDYNIADSIRGETQIRGVLFDKVMAMTIMAIRRSSPLGDGTVATTFPEAGDEQILPTLFRQIISNIVLPGEPGSPTDANAEAPSFDINLRDQAIELVKNELGELGLQSVMKGLMATQLTQVNPADESQKALAQFEVGMRDLLKQLYLGVTPEKQKELQAQIGNLVKERNSKLLFAQTKRLANDTIYKSPLVLEDFGMVTASGLFIRESINPYEQMGEAMALAAADLRKIIEAELAKPEKERKKEILDAANSQRSQLLRTRQILGQLVESQRTFLDRMYRAFNPNN